MKEAPRHVAAEGALAKQVREEREPFGSRRDAGGLSRQPVVASLTSLGPAAEAHAAQTVGQMVGEPPERHPGRVPDTEAGPVAAR